MAELSGIRVLVVEDSRTQAELTRVDLEDGGYQVAVAGDGLAGLDAALSGRFDVVLSDVVMPGIDGFEMCRRLKTTPQGRRAAVILYTSLSEPLDIIRGLESGAEAFVTKPCPAPVLRARIERLVADRQARSAADPGGGIPVLFLGQRFNITAEREQILSLLLATFEDAVLTSDQLRRREAEMAALNRELEQHAQALARANKAKSEFLANMSHELRTPLNAVLGFSDLLQEQLDAQLSDRHRRFLRNINGAGKHLLDLINDVLDLSKVEAGRIELHPEIVSAEALFESVIAAARGAAVAQGVKFTSRVAGEQSLLLDATRVRQVVFNLLSNAVKFTPADGSVELRADVAGDDLVIEVQDTGIGIAPELHHRVFGVFERLHEGQLSVEGTGLGLAISKRLVELHRGTISFESAPGRGTIFRVSLPDVLSRPVTGDRLLLLEDERHDADLIVALASSHDLRVEIARTMEQARRAMRRAIPLGVLIDVLLPDGDGIEFLRELKADASTRAVPTIVVTVEAEPKEAFALGADDYLTKPIDRTRLERWLAVVGRRQSVGYASAESGD